MAGTAKSNYLTVTDKNHKKVFDKMFFNQGQLNDYMKEHNFEEKYPKSEYFIYQECY